MKHHLTIVATLAILAGTHGANAYAPHVYANGISAHNIAAIQHIITQTAIREFAGSMGNTIMTSDAPVSLTNEDPTTTYGRAPMYGTAPMYGEYNDDGSAGRSGGDRFNADAALSNIWVNWQHMGDNAKFDNFSRLDTKFNTAMLGISGGQTELMGAMSKWGIYTGYVGGTQENSDISIDGQGGYFGIYNGNTFGNFGIYATANGGVIDNSADFADNSGTSTDEYTNFWIGGAVNATYNIELDRTFTLQPALHVGYTWIKSENYTSASGDILENDAFSILDVSPEIRAIKHIANGWFGAMHVKYAMIFDNGGDLSVNHAATDTLETDNFIEYGISLEKSVANISFHANFGRRDGARDGWIGGLNIKYLF